MPIDAETPPIERGSQWTDEEGPDFTVRSVSVDEDGVAQVHIREYTAGGSTEGRTLSVTAEDMRRRAAAGEIRRVD